MHNRITPFYIIILSVIILHSCNNSEFHKPEELGKVAFNFLKMVDKKNPESIKSLLPTVEDMREVARMGLIEDEFKKNKMLKYSIRSHENGLVKKALNGFSLVMKASETLDINWNGIEYGDFVFAQGKKQGLDMLAGKLLFQNNGTDYEIKLYGIKLYKGWKINLLYNLNQSRVSRFGIR